MQIFPKWVNKTPLLLIAGAPFALGGVVAVVWYYFSPLYTQVGYAPKQPVPYSHKLHAGDLGIDCRYCHYSVEQNTKANVPPTQVCMNCHKNVRPDSPFLAAVRASAETGNPVEWVRIHKVPDHAHFKHAPHVNAGVGCVECHGRIDQMPVVNQEKPLSMSWCLECHRDPAPRLRPQDKVTQMDWQPSEADKAHSQSMLSSLNPPQHCSGCHY